MMNIKSLWNLIIYNKAILIFLLVCNALGTIYGYIWYGTQLFVTPWYFIPFVPDSPTATLFLCIAIIALLFKKNLPIIECLAFVTLIKYGVWAVLMNIILMFVNHEISVMSCMLILSHGIMALQAFIFYPRFKVTLVAFIVTMVWVFHNDLIDYVFMQYPVYDFIEKIVPTVAYIAFILSIISLILYLFLNRFKRSKIIDLS